MFWQGPAECAGGCDRAKPSQHVYLEEFIVPRIASSYFQRTADGEPAASLLPHPFFILYSLLFSQEGFGFFVLFVFESEPPCPYSFRVQWTCGP